VASAVRYVGNRMSCIRTAIFKRRYALARPSEGCPAADVHVSAGVQRTARGQDIANLLYMRFQILRQDNSRSALAAQRQKSAHQVRGGPASSSTCTTMRLRCRSHDVSFVSSAELCSAESINSMHVTCSRVLSAMGEGAETARNCVRIDVMYVYMHSCYIRTMSSEP